MAVFTRSASWENLWRRSARSRLLQAQVLLFLATLMTMWLFLGRDAIATANEGQRAWPPIEMLETGDWLVPRLSGEPYLKKPPLLYWQIALSYHLFGVSPLAARLPGALAGSALVLTIFLWGRELLGSRAGFLAALFATTHLLILDRARRAQLDIHLCLFTTLLAWCWCRAFRLLAEGSPGWRKWIWAGGAFLAIANFYKVPVPFVFLLSGLIGTAAITGNLRLLRRPDWWLAMGASLLPVGVWASGAIAEVGLAEAKGTWQDEIGLRFRPTKINSAPFWIYLAVAPVAAAPWSLFGLAWLRRDFRACLPADRLALAWLAAWGLGSVAVLSCVPARESIYMICAVPMQCLLLAPAADWCLRRLEHRWGPMATIAILPTVLVVFAAVFHIAELRRASRLQGDGLLAGTAAVMRHALDDGRPVAWIGSQSAALYFQMGRAIPVLRGEHEVEAWLRAHPEGIVAGHRKVVLPRVKPDGILRRAAVVRSAAKEDLVVASGGTLVAPAGWDLRDVTPAPGPAPPPEGGKNNR